MRVLVLGAGPAGLIATHALALAGHDVLVYSKGARQSRLYGCQYLHAPIPGATTGEPMLVSYHLEGTPEGYREKVYGAGSKISVSPDQYADKDHLAWDLRQTYASLWDTYGSFVQSMTVEHPEQLNDMIMELKPDRVVSSIPAPLLCQNENHAFQAEKIWAMGDSPDQTVPIPVPANVVLCSGVKDVSWYRAANVFRHKTVEWPERRKPPYSGVASVTKPVATTCDCWPEVLRVGRYGRWTKGVLAHEAFHDTLEFMGDRVVGYSVQETLF